MPHEELSTREVKIRSLAALTPEDCLIVLEEIGGTRLFPIHTGAVEGQAILRTVSGMVPPRPQTHDLLVSVIEATGFKVTRVIVTEVKDGVYFSRLELERDGEKASVDARPSDALNVAVRVRCPIFLSREVLEGTDVILKPMGQEDVKGFKEQLERADLSTLFAELEKKPAPKERGREADRDAPEDESEASS